MDEDYHQTEYSIEREKIVEKYDKRGRRSLKIGIAGVLLGGFLSFFSLASGSPRVAKVTPTIYNENNTYDKQGFCGGLYLLAFSTFGCCAYMKRNNRKFLDEISALEG